MSKTNLILIVALVVQGGLIAAQAALTNDPAPAGARGPLLENLDVKGLSRVQVQSKEEGVSVEKNDDQWRVVESQGYEADTSKVESTLRELSALQISDVVATSKEHHTSLKVSDSDFERKVVLEGADGKKTELLFGTSSRANAVHVRKGGDDTVYAVADFSTWKLSAQPSAWIDRTYFKANRQRVQQVAIHNAAGTFRLERETPKDWALVRANGERVPADADKVESFLGDVGAITLTEVGQKVTEAKLATQPVAELVLALGEPPKAAPDTEKGTGEADGTTPGAKAPQEPAVVTETQTLKVYPEGKENDRFLMLREGAEFLGEAAKWNVQKLLEAKPDDFAATEFDAPPPSQP